MAQPFKQFKSRTEGVFKNSKTVEIDTLWQLYGCVFVYKHKYGVGKVFWMLLYFGWQFKNIETWISA